MPSSQERSDFYVGGNSHAGRSRVQSVNAFDDPNAVPIVAETVPKKTGPD